MGDLTLPGDIPGLLRRGSPVRWAMPGHAGRSGTLHYPSGGSSWACAYTQKGKHYLDVPLARELVLDLSDPGGRAHAAWWLRERFFGAHAIQRSQWMREQPYLATQRGTVQQSAEHGDTMTPEDIKALRDFVLHVAGR